MFQLTDESVQAAMDAMAGFLVDQASPRLGLTREQTAEVLLASQVYEQLQDPRTGRYWDSLPDLLEDFIAEVLSARCT